MNESFERIKTWAKAHPALAVGVLVALVVIGYLAYKKMGTSSGGGLAATGEESGLTSGGGGDLFPPVETVTPMDASYFTSGSIPDQVNNAIPSYQYALTPTAYSEQMNAVVNPNPFSRGTPLTEKITGNVVKNPNPGGTPLTQKSGKENKPASWRSVTTFPTGNLTSILGMQVAQPAARPSSGAILGAKVAVKTTPPVVPPVKQVTPARQ